MSKIECTLECIQALMTSMTEQGITGLKIKQNDLEIEINAQSQKEQVVVNSVMPGVAAYPTVQSSPVANVAEKVSDKPRGNIVTAPIVGTFYSAPSPKDKPFVSQGQKVAKGDVLFIIESMKVMNEVKSEFDGIVSVINVKDGEAVEFDQPVMIIE